MAIERAKSRLLGTILSAADLLGKSAQIAQG